MSDQYSVLGEAPKKEDLKKLSSNTYLTIANLSAGYGKMEILHDFDLFVDKAQSLCLIGPNGAGKSTILHSIYGFTNIFSGKIEIEGNEITFWVLARPMRANVSAIPGGIFGGGAYAVEARVEERVRPRQGVDFMRRLEQAEVRDMAGARIEPRDMCHTASSTSVYNTSALKDQVVFGDDSRSDRTSFTPQTTNQEQQTRVKQMHDNLMKRKEEERLMVLHLHPPQKERQVQKAAK